MNTVNDPEITPDLIAHERTYHAFNMLVRWAMLALATALTTLTIWFATSLGFLAGLVVGIIVWVVGYYGLVRHEAHQPLDPWAQGR